MIYQRGNPADYDRWAALGNEGWSWDEVLPYFKRAENQERGESEHHGVGGPINVADLRDPNPLSHAFVQACAERDLPSTTTLTARPRRASASTRSPSGRGCAAAPP